jgi:hypothetical protein
MNIKKPHQLRQSQFLRCTEHFNGLPQTVQLVRYIQVRLIDLLDQLLRSCPLDDINFTVYVKLIVPGNKIYILGNIILSCFFSDQIIFLLVRTVLPKSYLIFHIVHDIVIRTHVLLGDVLYAGSCC